MYHFLVGLSIVNNYYVRASPKEKYKNVKYTLRKVFKE